MDLLIFPNDHQRPAYIPVLAKASTGIYTLCVPGMYRYRKIAIILEGVPYTQDWLLEVLVSPKGVKGDLSF